MNFSLVKEIIRLLERRSRYQFSKIKLPMIKFDIVCYVKIGDIFEKL